MKPVLSIENLHFRYNKKTVLSGITCQISGGEITGILGPNGCGKSTLLKNILGYLRPESGEIRFHQKQTETKSVKNLNFSRVISFVPQKANTSLNVTVFDFVLMGRLPHIKSRWIGFSSKDRMETEKIIEDLGIQHFRNLPITCLSGGEQQKIMLARCLVQKAPIVLLDEATANLDMKHTIEIMDLIQRKTDEEGLTAVLVLHDLNLAVRYCSRLILMKKGIIKAAGTPEEIITPENLEDIYEIPLEIYKDNKGSLFVLPKKKETLETLDEYPSEGFLKQEAEYVY